MKNFKILIFEYICGGGLADQPIPLSLAAEGRLMLQTLINELSGLKQVEMLIPLDIRCQNINIPDSATIIYIDHKNNIMRELPRLINQVDAVWPIAPESNGLLSEIAKLIRAQNKIALLSSAEALRICSDKLVSYAFSVTQSIAMPVTHKLNLIRNFSYPAVIKPVDGVGCQSVRLIKDEDTLHKIIAEGENDIDFIIQPYIAGRTVSVSFLCKAAQAWLICCNEQHIEIEADQFRFKGCVVNVSSEFIDYYWQLAQKIAAGMPGLWGYIGMDLIEPEGQNPILIEINPRLTSSYAGIAAATGINVAEQVLALLTEQPNFKATKSICQKISV